MPAKTRRRKPATEGSKSPSMFHRPKPEKSHNWLTIILAIAIIALIVGAFAVMYYVLIAPQCAIINRSTSGQQTSALTVPATLGREFCI